MSIILSKKSILRKTFGVGSTTLISRLLGLIREKILFQWYLGPGELSDAFLTAFKIPNSLRKVFAEGALSAAFIPTIVSIVKKSDKKEASSLMTASFLVFESALIFLCLFIFIFAHFVIRFLAPGFPMEQVALTVPYLRILISFIIFISCSALLAGALQSVNAFFIPAFGPVLLNIVFIAALIICVYFGLPVKYLCFFIIFAGLLQFLLHVYAYFKLNFYFGPIDAKAKENLRHVLKKFFPVLFSMSVMEINLFIDQALGSYLAAGSISLIYLANRFMGIPLGVFAVAFSTILLPHFSRITTYAPKRLGFYLLESTKFVLWVTLPATLLLCFFAEKIFVTLFMSDKFPIDKVIEAKYILMAFLAGLFFFSINKILLNVYYSLHDTRIPTIISIIATFGNLILNLILMHWLQTAGLALATSISGAIQTILSFIFLQKKYNYKFYAENFWQFFFRYILQILIVIPLFWASYTYLENVISSLPKDLTNFFLNKTGFWFWTVPLCTFFFLLLYYTRRLFGLRLYFLD